MNQQPLFPTFNQALRYWLRLGLISFGGPAGQIAIMHRELVEQRRWISESHFLHALNFCMLLPGPEAQQLATYLGWRLHGWRGAIAAGSLFVLPSVLLLYGLSWLYIEGASTPWLGGLFYGLLPAVMAVVGSALLRIARKALLSPALWLIAALSFVSIFIFKISFIPIVLCSALIGLIGHRLAPKAFPAGRPHSASSAPEAHTFLELPPSPPPTWRRSLSVTALCLSLWWLPILALGACVGWQSTPFAQGIFFSKAALVTFGGAYAVLPYVAQQAVDHFGWLSHSQMMSGLGLAETTPGPLIIVLQFVGFLGAWQHPGSLPPPLAATLGALITTWATFLPCFLFVLLGAPHVEQLRQQPRLNAALNCLTAAVVGVMLNLTVWFAWHTLWPSGWIPTSPLAGLDPIVAVLSLAAGLLFNRLGLIPTIALSALLGMLSRIFT